MKSLGRLSKAIFAGIGFYAGAVIVSGQAGAVPVRSLPLGGPVCAGGVVALSSADGAAPVAAPVAGAVPVAGPVGAAPGIAGAAPGPGDATLVSGTEVPCGPSAADLTHLAGPVPMGLPGPVAPIPIAPIPVVPGLPAPVPLVAPGPAGAAAASPIAGLMTDAISAPIGLAGGTK